MGHLEQMFHEPGEDDEMRRRADELAEKFTQELGEDLARIGVYVKEAAIAQHPEGDKLILALQGRIGPLAFSTHVQAPDQIAIDERFEDLAETIIDEEYENRRRELLGGDDE